MRCEDYPCCGCGPEGCIDRSRTVSCSRCGTKYYPDPQTNETCYGCQQANAVDNLVAKSHGTFYECQECNWKGDAMPEDGRCPVEECGSEDIYEQEYEPIDEQEAMDYLDRMEEDRGYY